MDNKTKPENGGRALLHESTAELIRLDIEAGFYPRGTYLPSEADLCARFKVSRSTLRRALAALAHDDLITARAGIGHHVGGTIVSRQERGSNLVAVLAPYAEGATYFVELMSGLEHALMEAGLHLVTCNTDPPDDISPEEIETAHVKRLLQTRPKAVVVCRRQFGLDANSLRNLLQADIPIVQLVYEIPGLSTDFAGTDERLGGFIVADWLVQWADRIAVIAKPAPLPGLEQRMEGFHLAVSSRGYNAEEIVQLDIWTDDTRNQTLDHLKALSQAGRVGIFCAWLEDLSAIAGLLDNAGLKVGNEVAIGIIESPPWVKLSDLPPVISAHWSGVKMGEATARIILQQKTGDRYVAQRISVAPNLTLDPVYQSLNTENSSGKKLM